MARFGIGTAAQLSAMLLEKYGVGVLAGSEFGEPGDELRLRVASGLLYGQTDEQRSAALNAADAVTLPWIDEALGRLTDVLSQVTAIAPDTAPGTETAPMRRRPRKEPAFAFARSGVL
jgi:aspartate aminotransferase